MAGSSGYAGIDNNKVLNKEGLLSAFELIKTEMASTTGGGGTSYTFTNGLTESNGTVSCDLNDRIRAGSGTRSIQMGYLASTVNGTGCVAIGDSMTLSGYYNVGIGANHTINSSSISYSLAEGQDCKVQSPSGGGTVVAGHAEGKYTIAAYSCQHAEGKYNKIDNYGVFQHISGNGTANYARSNAQALDWSGNEYLAGNLYVGCNDFSTTSSGLATTACGGNKVATEAYVIAAVANASGGGGTANAATSASYINPTNNGYTETLIRPGVVSLHNWDNTNEYNTSQVQIVNSLGISVATSTIQSLGGNEDPETGEWIENDPEEVAQSIRISSTEITFDNGMSAQNGLFIGNNGYLEDSWGTIPSADTASLEDGTYILKCDMSDGMPSFYWELEE